MTAPRGCSTKPRSPALTTRNAWPKAANTWKSSLRAPPRPPPTPCPSPTTRPGGFDRKTGRRFHLNYLPWQSVTELLGCTTAGLRDTSVKVPPDSAGVAVTVTVHTPDGKTISRESIATVVYEEAAPAPSANQPPPARAKTAPLEKAERIAFKRAAAALGIRLPESFD